MPQLRPARRFGLLFLLYLLIWGNVFSPTALGFTMPLLDYLLLLAAQALPFLLLAMAVRSWTGIRRAASVALVIPFVVAAVPFVFGITACIALGGGLIRGNPLFERIHEMPARGGRVAVYISHGSAL